MRPVDVFGAGLLASAATGALCALGFLLLGWSFAEGEGFVALIDVLGIWLGAAAWIGLGAGLVLGIVPAAVGSFAWPGAVHSLGEARAVRRLTTIVSAVVLAELLAAVFGMGGDVSDSLWALPCILLVTALAAGAAWLHLQGARRMAHRRLERGALRF